MQKFWGIFLSVAGVVTLQIGTIDPISAQEDSGCFMKDSKGRLLDLSALCGNVKVAPLPSVVPSVKVNGTVFQAKIKRREHGIPVIDVVFNTGNSKQRFEMMVDTGASGTVITGQMANALGVVPIAAAYINTASERKVKVPLGYVEAIEVNGAVANEVIVVIQPALDMGLLGQDFFANYEVTVKKNVVEFRVPVI